MKKRLLSIFLLLSLLSITPAQADDGSLDSFLDSVIKKPTPPPTPRPAPSYAPPKQTAPVRNTVATQNSTAEIVRKRIRLSEPYDSDYELQQDIAATCAPVISIMHSNTQLSRAELFKNLKAFNQSWPWRSYQVLAVARNGSVIEIQVSYERSKGSQSSSGYARFSIILDTNGRICAMGEKSKKSAPPPFSPGMHIVNF